MLTAGRSSERAHHLRVVRSGRMHVVLDGGSIVAVAAESQASLGQSGSRPRDQGAWASQRRWACQRWMVRRLGGRAGQSAYAVWTVAVSAAGVAPLA